MPKKRKCVVKCCVSHEGTTDTSIHMFRIPRNYQLKEKWVEAIKAANNDNYEGNGLICQEHFTTEDIVHTANRKQLKKGSIPSLFLVDVIETAEISTEHQCDKCEYLETERNEVRNKFTQLNIDLQVQKEKLQRKADQQQATIIDKTKEIEKLQRQLRMMQNKNELLQEQLLIAKTTPGLNVIKLIYSFC